MNVFDLFAKITLDSSEYESGLDGSEKKTVSFGEKLKSGLQTAAKVGGVAFTAASGAVAAFTKSAVSSYADFEQLEGGIQKLYGNMGLSLEEYAASSGKAVDEVRDEWQRLEDAQNLVFNNAKNAYRTAGMDMNSYMEAATSFSASLINSLGGDTVKAAQQTDVAMRAISDNFNTFGGNIESVQAAFMGFSKGQFNLLDNLRLGYAGTKEGMKSLIADANEYAKANGQAANLSIDSFSDIVTAIDLVQQKQNIAGTTQREAASTIAGSLMMTKAAWQNLVTGITDSNADIDSLLNNVVTSAEAAFGNLLPAIEQALSGIASLIEKVAPLIAEKLPSLVNAVLPSLLSAATSLLNGVIAALPSLIQVLVEQIPTVATTLITGISETLPLFLEAGSQVVQSLTQGMSAEELIQKGGEILGSLVDYIIEWIPALLDQGIAMVDEMSAGLAENGPAAIEAIGAILGDLITKIIDNLPEFLEKGIELIASLAEGLIRNLPAIIGAIAQIIGQLIAYILRSMPQFLSSGLQMIASIASGLLNAQSRLWSAIAGIIRQAINKFKSTDWGSVGRNIIEGIANGVKNAAGKIADAARSAAKKALDAAKSFLGIHSPSRVFREQIGKNISLGLAGGISGYAAEVEDAAEDLAGIATDPFAELDSVTRTISADGAVRAAQTPGRGSDRDVLNRILEILEGLDLSNVGVYMDGKTLVGELVPAMDLAMGREASYKGRGVI